MTRCHDDRRVSWPAIACHCALTMQRLPLAIFATLGMTAIVVAGSTAYRLAQSKKLSQETRPFSAPKIHPIRTLLIVGDSTGVGVGSSSPAASIAGRLAQAMPRLSIENVSADGARYADLPQQLVSSTQSSYDIVLVLAGGNDVIRLTSQEDLRRQVNRVAEQAAALAPLVILMPSGNVGNAPFFFPPWSWWMTRRSMHLHRIIRETAARTGATYVNLYKSREEDPFARDPHRYHASDGLHPGDDGYALWVAELMVQSDMLGAGAKSSLQALPTRASSARASLAVGWAR